MFASTSDLSKGIRTVKSGFARGRPNRESRHVPVLHDGKVNGHFPLLLMGRLGDQAIPVRLHILQDALHIRTGVNAFCVSQDSDVRGLWDFLLQKLEWVAVRQATADYSQRSDFMGSVRTARRAGIKHAAIATSSRAKATLA